MIDLLSYLPSKRRATTSGWVSFDAPCCVHNGEGADRRQRGGLKTTEQGWSYHCFNCGFTASFIQGRSLSFKARRMLSWLGVPQEEIERANLESLRHRSMTGLLENRQQTFDCLADVAFEERDLPPFAELLSAHPREDAAGEVNAYWQYLESRSVPMDYPYMIQPNHDEVHWTRPHIVIPFTHHDRIVGYTARFLDGRQPRFISDVQPGYVFGTDLQQPGWTQAIVTEGIFDALSVSGLAVMHADISDAQARLIRGLGRDITVVPDQDRAGMKLVDRALELGWAVSLPDWPAEVKDVNDAVVRWGRLATLLIIMQSRETSRIKIEIRRKQIAKKLQ